jgi:predicted nucleic acid-binding protein
VTAVALDTNVLVYAEGIERAAADRTKIKQSRELLRTLADARVRVVAPLQMLAEFHRVLTRRGEHKPAAANEVIERWMSRTDRVATDANVFAAAISLASDHGLQIFDAIILAGAAQATCDALLSEDLHAGFVWRGVEVINPFESAGEARLDRLLRV